MPNIKWVFAYLTFGIRQVFCILAIRWYGNYYIMLKSVVNKNILIKTFNCREDDNIWESMEGIWYSSPLLTIIANTI